MPGALSRLCARDEIVDRGHETIARLEQHIDEHITRCLGNIVRTSSLGRACIVLE